KLLIDIVYSKNKYNDSTIKILAEKFRDEIENVVRYCMEDGHTGYTPSDFALVNISQEKIDELASDILLRKEAHITTGKAVKQIEDIYPLSPMQHGLLFHYLYDPGSPMYNERYNYTIEGPLNIETFTRAWEHVGKSHPIFRSVFRWEGFDQFFQVVLKDRLPEISCHDLTSADEKAANKEIVGFQAEFSQRSVDMAEGPLMKIDVFMLPENKFKFFWSYHHILMDG
ncbi:MAG: hypothetical protein GY863_15965, partial [bacterium]|nr:hypothetical protein [bacterium]